MFSAVDLFSLSDFSLYFILFFILDFVYLFFKMQMIGNAFEEVGYWCWDYASGGVLVAFYSEQNFVSRNCTVDISDAGGVLRLHLNLVFIFSWMDGNFL